MSKAGKQRSKDIRKAEKKKRKLENYLKFGPKDKNNDSKARNRLKGERTPQGRINAGRAAWSYKQKVIALSSV